MPWNLIGSVGGSLTVPPLDTTGADLLVVAAASYRTITGISDNQGNTWTPGVSTTDQSAAIYFCAGGSVGPGHVVTVAVTGTDVAIIFVAYSGSAASPADQSSAGTNSAQPGSITPSEDGELILTSFCVFNDSTDSVDSGFTIVEHVPFVGGTSMGNLLASLVQGTAAAVSPTWTSDGTAYGSTIMSFKAAPAAPSTGFAQNGIVVDSTKNVAIAGHVVSGLAAHGNVIYTSPTPVQKSNLLMHLDTNFSDATGRHVPAVTNAIISTAQPKFGAGSALLNNATQSCINVADNLADFTWDGDFTLDMWFYPTDLSQNANFYNLGDGQFHLYADWLSSDSLWHLTLDISGTNVIFGPGLTPNTWQHLAVTRSGSTVSMFLNGILAGTYSTTQVFTPSSQIWIGVNPGVQQTAGYLDEIRVVKGTAAWTANFTPPTAPYSS